MSEPKFTPEGYEVTSDGRVFSISSNWRGYGRREMRQHDNGDGYLVVRLTVGGKRRKFRVHQLVALAYHGPKPGEDYEVRHLDGNPKNNRAGNLAWGTRSENAKDRVKHGRQYIPEWDKPAFRQRATAGMRAAHKRNRELGRGRYA